MAVLWAQEKVGVTVHLLVEMMVDLLAALG